MRNVRFGAAMLALVMTLTTALTPGPARAASGAEIEREARKGLQDLYAKNPKARELGGKAKVLPFHGKIDDRRDEHRNGDGRAEPGENEQNDDAGG